MKTKYSLLAVIFISVILIGTRLFYIQDKIETEGKFQVTTYDALGYYVYLPSFFIYEDAKELTWFPKIEETYRVTGGKLYQANRHDNGNYVFKYLGGVALLQSPFFAIGHLIAKNTAYEPNGFSLPYQVSISFGAVFYCILSLFLLRIILLRYFEDRVVALTLIFGLLASNFPQYAAVDSAMSHGFIFPLYVLVLYATIKWHENPQFKWAALAGLVMGMATISRPTEAIMLFIPLFWNTQTKEAAKAKWNLVKKHRSHVFGAIIFGFLGILPQLLYWKYTTGSFVYDVGSKWDFASPHWRVLFGWEKGWFIYTPISILFIVGFFYLKNLPFKKSVLIFCLSNIYIIIAWHDWRYGGTYSCRALVQSYPLFLLALAAFFNYLESKKWRWWLYAICVYLTLVNFFQIWQYNKTIIHYDDMNRMYYASIYLNPNPSPLDMSLLDVSERLNREAGYTAKEIQVDTVYSIQYENGISENWIESNFSSSFSPDKWLKIEASIAVEYGFWNTFLNVEIKNEDAVKHSKLRLFNGISEPGLANDYAFYMKIPEDFDESRMKVYLSSESRFKGKLHFLKITRFEKK